MGILSLVNQVQTVSEPAAKNTLLNKTFCSAFSSAACSSDLESLSIYAKNVRRDQETAPEPHA